MGAEIDLHIDMGYPTVYNNEQLHEEAKSIAQQFMGDAKSRGNRDQDGPEDFGYYSQKVPGCFFRLGTAINQKVLQPAFIHLCSTLMKMPSRSAWESWPGWEVM